MEPREEDQKRLEGHAKISKPSPHANINTAAVSPSAFPDDAQHMPYARMKPLCVHCCKGEVEGRLLCKAPPDYAP